MATTGIDFSEYKPPGVYTEAVPGPQIGVRSSQPTAVGLFGTSLGYQTFTESRIIPPDSTDSPALAVQTTTLGQKGIKQSTIVVSDANTGLAYALNTDYTVVRVSAGPDLANDTRDDTFAIKRVTGSGGHIAAGDIVQIQYSYTDAAYFDPTIFYDYDDVREKYGPPFNTGTAAVNGVAPGKVLSELTLAAKFAFLNGAYQVICVPIDPANQSSPQPGEYGAALAKLENEEMVSVVVPATGNQYVHDYVKLHVNQQSKNKYERTGIVARDGSVTQVSTSVRQQDAKTLKSNRIAMVSPATFVYYSPELNDEVTLGGQYMAASLAGIAVSMNSAMPLTRKTLSGWREVKYAATSESNEEAKNKESREGLMVVEKTRRQQIQVRHGVTTDGGSGSLLQNREWSIIRQQDTMVFRIRDYLDNDGLIGMPIYDTTLINVKASAESALQSLKRDQVIRDYQDLKVRQVETLPDVIEVRYAWLPAYPLNYIVVRYAVTLPSGDMTLVSA